MTVEINKPGSYKKSLGINYLLSVCITDSANFGNCAAYNTHIGGKGLLFACAIYDFTVLND